jgi:hypothetical protein
MDDEDEDRFEQIQLNQNGPKERALRKIESSSCGFVDDPPNLAVPERWPDISQIEAGAAHRLGWEDPLFGLTPDDWEDRPKSLVSLHQFGERSLKGVLIDGERKRLSRRKGIKRIAWRKLVEKPQTFLLEGQRESVSVARQANDLRSRRLSSSGLQFLHQATALLR